VERESEGAGIVTRPGRRLDELAGSEYSWTDLQRRGARAMSVWMGLRMESSRGKRLLTHAFVVVAAVLAVVSAASCAAHPVPRHATSARPQPANVSEETSAAAHSKPPSGPEAVAEAHGLHLIRRLSSETDEVCSEDTTGFLGESVRLRGYDLKPYVGKKVRILIYSIVPSPPFDKTPWRFVYWEYHGRCIAAYMTFHGDPGIESLPPTEVAR
jgi:hypothetical protein